MRDYPLAAASNPAARTIYVPTGVKETATNLRQWYGPIQQQGPFGACTSFASLQWRMALRRMAGLSVIDPSYFANYYMERQLQGTVTQDSGASIDLAVQVLEQYGAMPELDDPYTPNDFAVAPPPQDWMALFQLHSQQAQRIHHPDILPHTLDALANGHPVLFGMTVFAELEQDEVAMTGYLSMPAHPNQPLGSHAVNCIGNDPGARMLLIANQWSAAWGIKTPPDLAGCFWMPYEYYREYAYDAYVGFPDAKND